jgi:type II secretion system protein I
MLLYLVALVFVRYLMYPLGMRLVKEKHDELVSPGTRCRRSDLRGFTLIEVLIALVVISVAFLAALRGSSVNLRSLRTASDLTTATMAADSLMKQIVAEGYPESGTEEGVFEEGPYRGLDWTRKVEVVELPYIEELKLVTVEISWGEGERFNLQTVLTR